MALTSKKYSVFELMTQISENVTIIGINVIFARH